MNPLSPILGGLVISYGSTYLIKYAIESLTYTIVKESAKAVKNSITDKNKIKKDIEYEYIVLDNNKDPILDETILVTSKRRISIDESWIDL